MTISNYNLNHKLESLPFVLYFSSPSPFFFFAQIDLFEQYPFLIYLLSSIIYRKNTLYQVISCIVFVTINSKKGTKKENYIAHTCECDCDSTITSIFDAAAKFV